MSARLRTILLVGALEFSAAPALAADPIPTEQAAEAAEVESGKDMRLVFPSGRVNRLNPVAQALLKRDPGALDTAKAWAKASKTPIYAHVNLDLPPEVEKAARTYVLLAGAGHPDALLYGVGNKNWQPASHGIAPGVDVQAIAHGMVGGPTLDEIAEERAKTPESNVKAHRLLDAKQERLEAMERKIVGKDNGETFLRAQWKVVQDHKAESHLRIVAGNGTSAPEIENLAHAVHTLRVDAAIARHCIQNSVNGDVSIKRMILEGSGMKPLPGVAEGFAQMRAEKRGEEVEPQSRRRTAGATVGRTVPRAVGVNIALFAAGTAVRKVTDQSHNAAVNLGGRTVDAGLKAAGALYGNHAMYSVIADPLARSFEQNIMDGKVPGTEPSLMYDDDFQAHLETVDKRTLKNPARLVEHIDAHLKSTGRPGLTVAQKENITAQGASAVLRPTVGQLKDHVDSSVIHQKPLARGSEGTYKPAAVAVAALMMANDEDATAIALMAIPVAKRLPPFAGAAVAGVERATPYHQAMNAVRADNRVQNPNRGWFARWRTPDVSARNLALPARDDHQVHTPAPAPAGAKRAPSPIRNFFSRR